MTGEEEEEELRRAAVKKRASRVIGQRSWHLVGRGFSIQALDHAAVSLHPLPCLVAPRRPGGRPWKSFCSFLFC